MSSEDRGPRRSTERRRGAAPERGRQPREGGVGKRGGKRSVSEKWGGDRRPPNWPGFEHLTGWVSKPDGFLPRFSITAWAPFHSAAAGESTAPSLGLQQLHDDLRGHRYQPDCIERKSDTHVPLSV